MITRLVFSEIVDEAREALQKGHLNDALFLIESLCKEMENVLFIKEYEQYKSAYSALLDFLARGGEDDTASDFQTSMIRKTWILLNRIDATNRAEQPGDYLYDSKQVMDFVHETKEKRFYEVMLNVLAAHFDWEALEAEVSECDTTTRRWLLSAVSLTLWYYLDPKAITFLSKYATTDARAVIGLIIAAKVHRDRLYIFPEAESVYTSLKDNTFFRQHTLDFLHIMFMSNQTEEITRRMNDEIFPTLLEASKDERLRQSFEMDLDEKDEFEKKLHEQQVADDPKLNKKRKQVQDSMTQLYNYAQEGYDMNAHNFNVMVRNPFFNKIGNWFKPFNPNDEAIRNIIFDEKGKPKTLYKMILQSPGFCDIDFYGLVLTMGGIKKIVAASDLMDMLETQTAEADAVMGGPIETITHDEVEDEVSVIRALYRFCYKSKWKDQFINIFNDTFETLLEDKHLQEMVTNDKDILQKIIDMLLRYNQSELALHYIAQLSKIEGYDANLLLDKADAEMELKLYKRAIESLRNAEILAPTNENIYWALNDCHDKLGQHQERLACLLELKTLTKKETKVTAELGLCLIQTKQYKEAVQYFYQLELAEKKLIPSQRSIAWCNFKMQNYEQALKYYKKIFKTPGASSWEDYMNAGHCAWLMGDVPTALTFYNQYIQRYLNDDAKRTHALLPFDNDFDELLEHGISPKQIQLMHDLISAKNF